jgi:hypothetical protein
VNKIKLWILSLFAKNLDDLIAVFVKLDKQLDAYIAKEKDEVAALETVATQMLAQANARNRSIERAGRIKENIGAIVR